MATNVVVIGNPVLPTLLTYNDTIIQAIIYIRPSKSASMKKGIFFSACFLFALLQNTYAQGVFDSSFAKAGKLIEKYSMPNFDLITSTTQADGKVLILGEALFNGIYKGVLVRYNTDGTLDQSLNGSGILRLDPSNGYGYIYDMKLQADGKILLLETGFPMTIIRLNSNGSFDLSFSGDGKSESTYSSYNGQKLKVLPNGKILVLCSDYTSPVLWRINSNGNTDSSYGSNGYLNINSLTNDPYENDMAVTSDGKILLLGVLYNNINELSLARVDSTGALDPSFNGTGEVVASGDAGSDASGNMIIIQPDGKILVSSYGSYDYMDGKNPGIFRGTLLLRYNVNGSLDNTFDGDGRLWIPASSNIYTDGYITLQPDNKILISGTYKNGVDYEFASIRVNANGSLDNTYDGDGVARINLGNGLDYLAMCMVQPDLKIVAVGISYANNALNVALARFTSVGAWDQSYSSNGKAILLMQSDSAGNNGFTVVKSLSNDKVVAGGYYSNGYLQGALAARYGANGLPDAGFGIGGFAAVPVSYDELIQDMKIQPDGKIVILGTADDLITGPGFFVARLDTTGKLDSSFAQGGRLLYSSSLDKYETAHQLVIQPDGKIVVSVGVEDMITYHEDGYFMRFKTDGSLDSTYNGTGILATDIVYPLISSQTDNKIVATGSYDASATGQGTNLATRRYLVNGALDASFNSGAPVITHFSTFEDNPAGQQVLANGKIAIGCYSDGALFNTGIAMYNPNGSPDISFATAGKAPFNLPYNISKMMVDTGGKFILSGTYHGNNNEVKFAVSRAKSNGTIDSSFANNGHAILAMEASTYDQVNAIELSTQNSILIAGDIQPGNSNYYESDGAIFKLKKNASGLRQYVFTGNGNWSVAANWAGGAVPPNPVPPDTEIIINHAYGNQCILNIPITVQPGGKIIVPQDMFLRVGAGITLPSIQAK